MAETTSVRQYLKDYNADILYPYTLLDCILADENGSNVTGADAIVSSILSEDLKIYEKNNDHITENYVHSTDINGENLFVMGMYINPQTNKNKFIRLHAISDDESASNKYLGADGNVHSIGNNTGDDIIISQSSLTGLYGNATSPTWFDGTVVFDSSSCSITLNPRLNSEDFYVEGNHLRVRTADHVKQAQLLVDPEDNKPFEIGLTTRNGDLLMFKDGMPAKSIANAGTYNKFIYLENGSFTPSNFSFGGKVTTPIENHTTEQSTSSESEEEIPYKDEVFALLSIYQGAFVKSGYSCFGGDTLGKVGTYDHPSYVLCVNDGILRVNYSSVIGGENQLIYIDEGKFKESNFTVGDPCTGIVGNRKYPISLVDGKFGTCDEIGDEGTPIYINSYGEFSEVKQLSVNNIEQPIISNSSTNEYQPYVMISDWPDGYSQRQNTWKNIDDFISDTITEARLPWHKGDPEAKTLIARVDRRAYIQEGQITYEDPDFLSVGWEELPHSVKITTEDIVADPENAGLEDAAFYLTGVFSGPKKKYKIVNSSDGIDESVFQEIEFDSNSKINAYWNEYHDLENGLAKQLQVAASGIYPDDTELGGITGIYFKHCKLYQSSDERLKTFTQDLDINLDNLSTIKKGIFYWTNDKKQRLDIGVTAQSVEKYFPEIVDEDKGVKTVSYSKLGVIALAAIDKLNEKIKQLEQEIKDLKDKKDAEK